MNNRFEGADGRINLIDALLEQSIINGNSELAVALANVGELRVISAGKFLITQGSADNDIFLILAGTVLIEVHGRQVAKRSAGHHVGEMSLLDNSAPRSASVRSHRDVVALRIGHGDFIRIADAYPFVWRRLARDLSRRLTQRNEYVRARNETPIVFVGSSVEGKPIADEIQAAMDFDPVLVTVWTNRVFGPSGFPVEKLLEEANVADFAVIVATPDDVVVSREIEAVAPRDNVVFELGVFMGALGRDRTYCLRPRGVEMKMPSDLVGVLPLTYEPTKLDAIASCVGSVCTELRSCIQRLGPR